MSRPGVMLYFSVLPALDSLGPTSAGTLLLASMHYAQNGQEPVFEDSTLAFAWAFLKPSIDRDGEAYDEKRQRGEWLTYCRQCKRDDIEPMDFVTWRQRTVTESLHTDTNTKPISMSDLVSIKSISMSNKSIKADKPPTRTRFVPPSIEEVAEYVKQRGSKVDPQGFIDFYASKGWRIGKTPMKDWKAACRNAEHWERWDKKQNTAFPDYSGGESFV